MKSRHTSGVHLCCRSARKPCVIFFLQRGLDGCCHPLNLEERGTWCAIHCMQICDKHHRRQHLCSSLQRADGFNQAVTVSPSLPKALVRFQPSPFQRDPPRVPPPDNCAYSLLAHQPKILGTTRSSVAYKRRRGGSPYLAKITISKVTGKKKNIIDQQARQTLKARGVVEGSRSLPYSVWGCETRQGSGAKEMHEETQTSPQGPICCRLLSELSYQKSSSGGDHGGC